MKKLLMIPLMLLAIALSACGSNNNEEVVEPKTPETPATPGKLDNNTQTSLNMKITDHLQNRVD